VTRRTETKSRQKDAHDSKFRRSIILTPPIAMTPGSGNENDIIKASNRFTNIIALP
jgi:hypothetical protein